MNRFINLLIVFIALTFVGCSQRSKTDSFSSYQDAKEFCDATVRAKNLSGLIKYADLTGVPEPTRKQLMAGLNNFESAISKKTLQKTLEFSPEEHLKFLKAEFAKQTPEMQKLTGPWPDPKWNILPDRIVVYVFSSREAGAESEFQLTFGFNHQKEGWVLVCSY